MQNFRIKPLLVWQRERIFFLTGSELKIWKGDIRDIGETENISMKARQCVEHDRQCAKITSARQ